MKLVFEVSGDNMLFGFIVDGNNKDAINNNVKMTFSEAEHAAAFFNVRMKAQPGDSLEMSIADIVG